MTLSDFCATCGRRRGGLEQRRSGWSATSTPIVPRSETEGRPWQQTNDLIVAVHVYRNGGTSDDCHLCSHCLAVGLRAAKVAIEAALNESDVSADKDAEIARLTQLVGQLQHDNAELKTLRSAGLPDWAWRHKEFLDSVAKQWVEYLARFRREQLPTT